MITGFQYIYVYLDMIAYFQYIYVYTAMPQTEVMELKILASVNRHNVPCDITRYIHELLDSYTNLTTRPNR